MSRPEGKTIDSIHAAVVMFYSQYTESVDSDYRV